MKLVLRFTAVSTVTAMNRNIRLGYLFQQGRSVKKNLAEVHRVFFLRFTQKKRTWRTVRRIDVCMYARSAVTLLLVCAWHACAVS